MGHGVCRARGGVTDGWVRQSATHSGVCVSRVKSKSTRELFISTNIVKGIMWKNSAFTCLTMMRPLSLNLSSCVLRSSQMFPRLSKLGNPPVYCMVRFNGLPPLLL